MLNQYGAQRFRRNANGKHVGTIPVGTIVYIQDGINPLGGFRRQIICRDPWQVECWVPGERTKWDNTLNGYVSVPQWNGHLAQVRSLRTGRRQKVADWILLRCIDAGLERL